VACSVPITPGLGAGRNDAGRRRLGEKAAVAGPAFGAEHRHLPFEAHDRTVHVGAAQLEADVVDEVTRGEIVAAVDDDFVARHDRLGVGGRQAQIVRHDLDFGIERGQSSPRRVRLGRPDVAGVKEHLPMKVGDVHPVEVDQPQRTDTRGREIKRRRRAETPGADHQHAR
jgi:hypothetical protein